MSDLKLTTTIGGNTVWHGGNIPLTPDGNQLFYSGHEVYTEFNKPTPTEIGLGNVPNYRAAVQSEAEAGTRDDVLMTPLKVDQFYNFHTTTFSRSLLTDNTDSAMRTRLGVYSKTESDDKYALDTRTITAGDGLSGGGDLQSNRTISVDNSVIRSTGDRTLADSTTLDNNHNKSISDFNAVSGDVNRWNSSGNYTLSLQASNNALAFLVGGTINNRTAVIQVGHNSGSFASALGTLWLNKFGGDVRVGDNFYADELHGSFIGNGSSITNLNPDNLSTTVPYTKLPFGSTDVSQWGTAYDRSVDGVSGNGNSTLRISRQDGNDVTTNLAHTHDASDVTSGTLSSSRLPTITTSMVNFANQSLNTNSTPVFDGFKVYANTSGYTGIEIEKSDGTHLGYLISRVGVDSTIYYQNGLTLVADSGHLSLAARSGNDIVVSTNAIERMRFTHDGAISLNGGNVGIGTDNPSAKLTVNSNQTDNGVLARIESDSFSESTIRFRNSLADHIDVGLGTSGQFVVKVPHNNSTGGYDFEVGNGWAEVAGNKVYHEGHKPTASEIDAVVWLNSQTDPNLIKQSSATRLNPHGNNPTNTYYALSTFGNNGNVTGQLATNFVSGEAYTRGFNTSWSAWRKQWDSSNFNPSDYLSVSGKAADANLLDGLNSTQFLRSDVDDTFTKTLTVTQTIIPLAFKDGSQIGFIEHGRTYGLRIRTREGTTGTGIAETFTISNGPGGGISWDGVASGNGSGLTSLNASNINTGKIADNYISKNFNTIRPATKYGITGGYGYNSGSGGNWGSNIWSIGDDWAGDAAGTGFSLDTSQYGLVWLRETHPNATSIAGEGLYIYRSGILRAAIGNNGHYFDKDVRADSFRINSDITLKDNISDYKPESKISDLQLKQWIWKDSDRVGSSLKNQYDTGVIAQDVEKVFPTTVKTDKEGIKSVDYGKLGVHHSIKLREEYEHELQLLKQQIKLIESRTLYGITKTLINKIKRLFRK